MIRVSEKSVFSFVILVFSCVILFLTQDMRSDVALVPKMVAVLLLIFSGLQVLMDLFPAVGKTLSFLDRKSTSVEAVGGEGEGHAQKDAAVPLWQRYSFFGWVVAYIVLIYFTSMIWATLIALFVYLKWVNKESWMLSILYTLGTVLFIYVVFVVGFKLNYFLDSSFW